MVASNFGNIPGHIPPKVKLSSWPGNTINRNWFDLKDTGAQTDWNKLTLPGTQYLLSEMSGPKKGVKKDKNNSQNEAIVENKPIKVKLASASQDYMYRGGKKECVHVMIPQGFVVDMHADVLFEALMRDGMNNKTKELNSEFIMATIKGSTRLIRVNSDLHKLCLEKMALDNKPKLDVKTMSVGEVYETKAGNMALFLGFVTTKYLKATKQKNSNLDLYTVKYSNMKIATLWMNMTYWADTKNSKTLTRSFNETLAETGRYGGILGNTTFKTQSGHGYVNKVSRLYVDVPNDIIRTVRLRAIGSLKADLKQYGIDCAEYEKWIARGTKWMEDRRKQQSHWSYGGGQNEFSPPYSVYEIQSLIAQTKMTNMTVFGLHAEPTPQSKVVEKMVELWNMQCRNNLSSRNSYR